MSEQMTPTEPPPSRLLVVDDEESVALTLAEVLRQEGLCVETVGSGAEAAARLRAETFDLVLTDLHMDSGDGLSLLAELRRVAPFTSAIVLTGFASVESAIAALREGAYDYLIKPCIVDDLKHTVRRGLEHRRLRLAEREARASLEEINRELEQRVADRTAELQKLNEELVAANRAKDIFLATLSHELRTPLTPVLGWVNILRSGGTQDQTLTAQALDAIERNARLQTRLIDDLLDISRIVTGKLRLDLEPTDLRAVVTAALDTVRNQAAARRIKLQADLPDAPLIVLGMPVRLQQVIWNLLTNAIKFTETGGSVMVRAYATDSEVLIEVADTGVGIPPNFLPHVFDSFRQADGSTTRQHGGLGLGLAIVRALTEMHSGWVRAESAGVGRGSRFTVGLPRAARAGEESEVEAHAAPFQFNQPVLLVEDSPDTLELLQLLFARKGCEVMAAASAEEALLLVSRQKPAVIISDLGMPEIDGYELLRRLRHLPGMENVPAIALSGYAMEEDRDRALASGFTVHMAKPVDAEKLYMVVQQLTTPADDEALPA